MEIKKQKISGEIRKIFLPQSGVFFDDAEYTRFGLILDDGRFVIAHGDSFPLFEKMEVTLTGEMQSTSGKYPYFRFYDIERKMEGMEGYDKLLITIAGPGTAFTLAQAFGNSKKALEIIATRPELLTEIKGIGDKTKERLLKNYEKNVKIEETYKELKSYGFSIKDTIKILKKIRNVSVRELIKNPYILFQKRIFSFKACDDIALRNNLRMDTEERLKASIFATLRTDNLNGNTYTPKDMLLKNSLMLLKIPGYTFDRNRLNDLFNELVFDGHLVEENELVYTNKTYQEEVDIRTFVEQNKNLKLGYEITEEDINEYERYKGFKLGIEQRKAVLNSASSALSVITGGPGTGKTTILDCLMFILKKRISSTFIGLCSPTGKAARRMTESTNMPAYTIHTFLGVDPTSDDLETFIHNEDNKLHHQLIVIDEASMIDQFIGASLIRAIRRGTQVIFVGDIEQLPPVGAGYFLRDLIEADVTTSRLIEVYRQAGDSKIIKLSQEIRNEKIESYASNKKDFGFVPVVKKEMILKTFLRAVKDVGVENVVILTPQNIGELGTKAFSNEILDILIKDENKISKNGWNFKEGARIMQIRNNNELGIVNGQMGFIRKINYETKTLLVGFDGLEEEFEYDSTLLEDLALGYAITIHKSQGSEWKYVIQIVSSAHTMMNTKPLVYTGITRAKEKLIIFADKNTFKNSPRKKPREIRSKIIKERKR